MYQDHEIASLTFNQPPPLNNAQPQFSYVGLIVLGVMAKFVFTRFQILKPTMNKWAQYPAQMEA